MDSKRKPLIDVQHHGGDARRQAKPECHDADQRVVAEQHIGEQAERLDGARPRRKDLLVIELGRTSQEAVIDALDSVPQLFEKRLGVLLNQQQQSRLKRRAR